MEDKTLLFLISQRLDNKTLEKLAAAPSLWIEIKKFLVDEHFWYLRACALSGRELIPRHGADWKKIYGMLLTKRDKYEYSLDDLDMMKVLIEVYGPPEKDRTWIISLAKKASVEVLSYLLQQRYISYSHGQEESILANAALNEHLDMVKFLLTLPGMNTEYNIIVASGYAASNNHIDVVRLLLEEGVTIPPVALESILLDVVKRGYLQLIEYLMPLAEPNDLLLKTAVEGGRLEVIRAILQDSRVDPNSNLEELLHIIQYRWGSFLMIDLLVRDKRIDTDNLDINILRSIIRLLSYEIDGRIGGFILANTLVGGEDIFYSDVKNIIEYESSSYALLVRFLIIKRPSSEDLLRRLLYWAKKNKYIGEAARSIIQEKFSVSKDAVPFRSLMLSILDISLRGVVQILRAGQAEDEDIILASRLVGAHLGLEKMQNTS